MLQYILKLSISLSVVYLFYQLLLRRLTFYTLNRWYLMAYPMLCFVIPFINVFTIVSKPAWRQSAIIGYIPAIEEYTKASDQRLSASSFNWMYIVTVVIVMGMVAMIIRLLIQYYSLFRMRSKAVLLYDDKVKLYHIDKPIIPFSFGKAIFVNQRQHNEEELKDIIRHEFIHVKQRHSLDLLWSELLCIVNWYNPFAWLLRKDIRQNLEFIADQQVLQTGLDRKQYQYLLLKVVGINAFSIASNFNFSSLKKRIAMMNKTKSAKVHLIRFLFILPLLVVILLAFRNTRQQQPLVLRKAITDTVPVTDKKISSQDIESMSVTKTSGAKMVTVTLKNGQVEKYNLNDPKDQEAFKSKYGELPEPPKPPATPEIITATDAGKGMTINLSNNTAIVTLENGTIEKYDLKNPKEKKAFESKYEKHPGPAEVPEPPASAAEPPVPPAPFTVSLNEVRVVSDVSPDTKVVADPKPVTSVNVQPNPVTTVIVKPLAVGTPEPVAGTSNSIARIVVADTIPKRIIVKDDFQGSFNDPKHLPSEILGIINKTDNEDQLKQLQKRIEARGFKLEIDNTTYVNGVLANVVAKISNTEANNSFSATDFDKILLIESMEKSGKFAGFHVVIKNGTKYTTIQ